MPDYSSTYLGRAPGELEDEKRKKKLGSMFRNTAQAMGMDEQPHPLAQGSPLGMKKSVFGGGTKAPDLFGGGQHASAVSSGAAENPYAGLFKGLGAMAGAMAEEPAKRSPEDIAKTPNGPVENTPEGGDKLPTDITQREVGPPPMMGGPKPAFDKAAMPEMGREEAADPYRHDRDIAAENAGDHRGLPPDGDRESGASVYGRDDVVQPTTQQTQPPAPGPTNPSGPESAEDQMYREAGVTKMPSNKKPESDEDRMYREAGVTKMPSNKKEEAPLEGSRKTLAEIKAATNAPTKKPPSWWRRFGAGAAEAVAEWQADGQKGGNEGLFARVLGRGIRGATDKKGYAEKEKQAGIGKLWKRYESEMEFEKGETAKKSAETNLKYLENKHLIEGQEKDEERTPAEAQKLNDLGIAADPYDARKVTTVEKDGDSYSGYTGGTRAGQFEKNRTLPTERSKKDVKATADGEDYYVPSSTAFGAKRTAGNQTATRVAAAEKDKATKAAAGDKSRAAAKQKVLGGEVELAKLKAAREKKINDDKKAGNDEDTVQIDKDIAKLEGELTTNRTASLPTYDEAHNWLVDKVQGKKVNPDTKKPYTEEEAIEYARKHLAVKGAKGKYHQ